MCKCNVESIIVTWVDCLEQLRYFGMSQEFVSNLIDKKANRKGFLLQCPSCKEYSYIGEDAYYAMQNASNEAEELNNSVSLSKYKTESNDFTNGLMNELKENVKTFLDSNGSLVSQFKKDNQILYYYKIKNTCANEDMFFLLVQNRLDWYGKDFIERHGQYTLDQVLVA